jgi:hypothetical protein
MLQDLPRVQRGLPIPLVDAANFEIVEGNFLLHCLVSI